MVSRLNDVAAADRLAAAAAAAAQAPSIHNTQPWRWRIGSRTADLYLEPSRLLPATDPDRRLATLSCGTALHHVQVALAAAGPQPKCNSFPSRTTHST
ncbi:hypothetical protein ACFQZ4_46565 [Catellatospora coxensis]